jgi:hypothetical protein
MHTCNIYIMGTFLLCKECPIKIISLLINKSLFYISWEQFAVTKGDSKEPLMCRRGSVVVEALYNKPEGRGIAPR